MGDLLNTELSKVLQQDIDLQVKNVTEDLD